jgi:hypothetical protein
MEETELKEYERVRARCVHRAALALSISDEECTSSRLAAVRTELEAVADVEEPDRLMLASHLANLAHWCDAHGHEFSDALRLAEIHYTEETNAGGQQEFYAAPRPLHHPITRQPSSSAEVVQTCASASTV